MIARMIIEFEVPDGITEDDVEETLNQSVTINTSENPDFIWMNTDFEHDVLEGDSIAAQRESLGGA